MKTEEITALIQELACSLAEKELVDNYNKTPQQLCTKSGCYKAEYQDDFNKSYDKYESKLIELSGKSVDEIFPH